MLRSICAALTALPDYRAAQRRHPLSGCLIALFLSKLVGCDGWDASADWIAGQYARLRRTLTLWHTPPSSDTLRRMAERLDISDFFSTMSLVGTVMHIDGKRARGARADGKIHHFIEAFMGNRVVGMVETGEGAESPAIIDLLRSFDLQGITVTIDAAGTTPAVIGAIIEQKGDYLLAVEANQPTLLGEIRQAFAENASPAHLGKCHAHGRFESRRARTLTHPEIIASLSVTERLPNIRAICWVQRTRITQEGIETTNQFHISSRPIGPRDYMSINRSHWSIEAMHHVLDVSLAEDQSRIAKAAAVAGAMRRHAYAIIDGMREKMSFKRCAAKLRANPEPILAMI